MSQCPALDALRGPYLDAVLEDRFDDAAEIYREAIEPDFEYVERTSGGVNLKACVPEFVVENEDAWDDLYDERPATPKEARDIRIRAAQQWKRIDWLKWIEAPRGPFDYGLTSFNAILKEHYTDARVRDLATSSNPFIRMVRGERAAIEARVASYTNLVTYQPGFGIFTAGDV